MLVPAAVGRRNASFEMDKLQPRSTLKPRRSRPEQALLLLQYIPQIMRDHGLDGAHVRPLVGRRLPDDSIQSWRTTPQLAWMQPLIEWARTPLEYLAIVLDIDDQIALELLGSVNMGTALHVPKPNFAVYRRRSGHALAAYTLRRPVLRGKKAKPKPLSALARISEWLAIELRADAGYTGVLAANPVHKDYETVWLRQEPYSLADFRRYMPARWTRPPKTAARTDAGRNHDLFEGLLEFAGRADITDDHVVAYARQMYARIDKLRPHAFTGREVHGITMSVLRYRDQWRDRGWHKTAWLEHQRAAAAKNSHEAQRAKGRLGGLRSGQARRSRTHDRDQRILEALAAGESTRSVAAAEGLSHVAVHLIGRRLTGVKRSHHTDDPPIGGPSSAVRAPGPNRPDQPELPGFRADAPGRSRRSRG